MPSIMYTNIAGSLPRVNKPVVMFRDVICMWASLCRRSSVCLSVRHTPEDCVEMVDFSIFSPANCTISLFFCDTVCTESPTVGLYKGWLRADDYRRIFFFISPSFYSNKLPFVTALTSSS